MQIVPPPAILKQDVACFMIVESDSTTSTTINVSPNAVPGIVFQHINGHPAIDRISTSSGKSNTVPSLFLYAAGTEPSVMHFNKGTYTTIQVIFKAHALNTLFAIEPANLTDGFAELDDFSSEYLSLQLMEADNTQAQVTLLTKFLIQKFKQIKSRDLLVEEGLRLIHKNIAAVTVRGLLEQLNISERQFERRFIRAVGISAQSYIRVKRFNHAVQLIKYGQYDKLTDVAHSLNFYDQSHLIREIKAFTGITPKTLSRKKDDFYHMQTGYSF